MYWRSNRSDMDKENSTATKFDESNVRVTRSRAKSLAISGGLSQRKPSLNLEPKKALNNSKRAVLDENQYAVGVLQSKKRTVLGDVTNILCENSYLKCQPSKQDKRVPTKKAKVAPAVFVGPQVQEENVIEIAASERNEESQDTKLLVDKTENLMIKPSTRTRTQECGVPPLPRPSKKGKCKLGNELDSSKSNDLKVTNIDSNHTDPLMCSLYAPDIYKNLSVTELDRRPSSDYMSTMQQEITHNMRGILVDWLVEVSEEYKLVPDTLYLTVNIIDRFLSENKIEKSKLQLIGITCMLIASKYEEICAPRVEDFCFITDNTYKREDVVKMESQILNFLGFHLSVPTTKKFLRRFIQAAQTSYEVPRVEFEFLANYLAELTLTEYNFLKFLPSLVAASAVFLARWTLDQSIHPWNPTLEHYTSYKVSELKPTVLGLQELQLNSKESPLHAIHEKYKLQKFKCVATLSSPELVESLFESLKTAGPSNMIIN